MDEKNPDILGFRLKNAAASSVARSLREIREIGDEFCRECDSSLTITSNWSTFSRLYELLHGLFLNLQVLGVDIPGADLIGVDGASEVMSEDDYSAFMEFKEIGMNTKVSGMQVIEGEAAMFMLDTFGHFAQIYDLMLAQYKKSGRIELSYQQLHDICHAGSDLDLKLEEFADLSDDVFVAREESITSF